MDSSEVNGTNGKGHGNGKDDSGEFGPDVGDTDGMGSDEAGSDSDEGIDSGPPWSDAGTDEMAQKAHDNTKRAQLRLAERVAESEDVAQDIRLSEPDLAKRAKALMSRQLISFPEDKQVMQFGIPTTVPLNSDANRWEVFEKLFGNGPDRPHMDLFRGRLVDADGRIIDDHYAVNSLVMAMSHCNLKQQVAGEVRRSFKEWALADKRNDMIDRLEAKLPQWDGTKRIDTHLIKLFEPMDTELNRAISKYFWLSLYVRIMHPGVTAPIVLSLIGAQHSGKSYLSKLICEEIIGDKNADAVKLDLGGNRNEFLRAITGNSVVANIGEMAGFRTADLNKIKDFITTSSDMMHHKYEGDVQQPRQWICVMDSNRYEGLQRDDTGNRRFYPMFVGQLPDREGQPRWKEEYEVNYKGFRTDIWQLLAECRVWIEENGVQSYESVARDTANMVKNFSAAEMKRDRGTIRDDELEAFLLPALRSVRKFLKTRGTYMGKVSVLSANLIYLLQNKYRIRVNVRHLKTKMEALGAVNFSFTAGDKGYVFTEYDDLEDFNKHVGTFKRWEEEDSENESEDNLSVSGGDEQEF